MKIKKMIIPIILILFGIIITFIYFFDFGQIIVAINPSNELKRLKQIEDGFNLPASSRRRVVDEGNKTDWKGAGQYSRSISNYYEEKSLILLVKENVENRNWILAETSDSLEKGGVEYKYFNDQESTDMFQTEIIITINPKENGDKQLLNDDHSIMIRSVTIE